MVRIQTKGVTLLIVTRISGFLSVTETGNNSGAPKLTLSGLKHQRGNRSFTFMAGICAVHLERVA